MAEAFMCNNCRGFTPKDVANWYRLERADEMIGLAEYPGPWHFCTLKCLIEWSEKRQEDG